MPTGSEKTISNIPHEAKKTPARQGSGVRCTWFTVAESTSRCKKKKKHSGCAYCCFWKNPRIQWLKTLIFPSEVVISWVHLSQATARSKPLSSINHMYAHTEIREPKERKPSLVCQISIDLWGVPVPRCALVTMDSWQKKICQTMDCAYFVWAHSGWTVGLKVLHCGFKYGLTMG